MADGKAVVPVIGSGRYGNLSAEELDVGLEDAVAGRKDGTLNDEKSAASRSASPSGASRASRSSQSAFMHSPEMRRAAFSLSIGLRILQAD